MSARVACINSCSRQPPRCSTRTRSVSNLGRKAIEFPSRSGRLAQLRRPLKGPLKGRGRTGIHREQQSGGKFGGMRPASAVAGRSPLSTIPYADRCFQPANGCVGPRRGRSRRPDSSSAAARSGRQLSDLARRCGAAGRKPHRTLRRAARVGVGNCPQLRGACSSLQRGLRVEDVEKASAVSTSARLPTGGCRRVHRPRPRRAGTDAVRVWNPPPRVREATFHRRCRTRVQRHQHAVGNAPDWTWSPRDTIQPAGGRVKSP